jgi:hypothetical protein
MLEHRYTLSGIPTMGFDAPAELAEAAPPAPDTELRDSGSMQGPVAATSAPVISEWDAFVDEFGALVVQGRVTVDGQYAEGLTVSISWWNGEGDDITDSMGRFYYAAELEEPGEGWVYGVTWNEIGESEMCEQYVEWSGGEGGGEGEGEGEI